MGMRGVAAHVRRTAREAIAARGRRRVLPWQRNGLSRVRRVLAFLEFLPITKGRLQGRRLRLLPNQREFIEMIYSPRATPVRLAVKSEPRGNGKTGLIAGLALCHLLGPEAEPRGEVYSAAKDRAQAALIYTEMEAIILSVPEFAERINLQRFQKKIEVLDGDGEGSTYEALSADARRAHGLAPTFWAYDELAQARDRVLLDNLQTAMGKRNWSLGVIISTQAAGDEHPLSEIIDDGLAGHDPSVVVQLTAAPIDADIFDPAVIRSVNPAFGKFLDETVVLQEAERARRLPSNESAFRNLRLNQRVAGHLRDQFLSLQVFDDGSAPIEQAIFSDGRPVYAGLDLSQRLDLTAAVFAAEDDHGVVHLLPRAWTPAASLDVRSKRDRAPYDGWVRDGFLQAVPGNVIDYEFVAHELAETCGAMHLARIYYDRWRIDLLRGELAALGVILPLMPCGQGFKDMSPCIEAFEGLIADRRIRHGGHPVLRWCFANAITARDPAGSRKLDKSRPDHCRIDLAQAAVMAVGAMKACAQPPVDVAAMIA